MVNKVGIGLSGWVIKTGQSLRVMDVNKDARYVASYPGIQSRNVCSDQDRSILLLAASPLNLIKLALSVSVMNVLLLRLPTRLPLHLIMRVSTIEIQRELEERKSAEASAAGKPGTPAVHFGLYERFSLHQGSSRSLLTGKQCHDQGIWVSGR